MGRESEILREPEFQRMLTMRSRWRWGLSGGLIGTYFAYCLAGIYFNEAFSRVVLGSSITLGILLGYLIIVVAIVLSIIYVRIVARLLATPFGSTESDQ